MKMNKTQAVSLLSAALLSGASSLQAANITINDNNLGSNGQIEQAAGWYKGGVSWMTSPANSGFTSAQRGNLSEYQEIEPGMATGALWDLAAFVTPSAGRLGVVSGYNLGGVTQNTRIGDIMVKVGPVANNYGDQNQAYTQYALNTFGYDFAVRMNFGANTYSVFAIDANTMMENGQYAANGNHNSASSPWRLATTTNGNASANIGTAVAGFQNLSLGYLTNNTVAAASAATGYTVTSDYKYYVEINTTFVNTLAASLNSPTVLYKLTMECGNDNMLGVDTVGQNVAVPDGASTLALMGIGLLSIVGLARVRFQAV